jgi:hypothetical protein
MPLAEKVDTETFIRQLRIAPQGILWMSEHNVLMLRVLDGGTERIFEAPDPADFETDTDGRAFLAEIARWLAEPGVRERIWYYCK